MRRAALPIAKRAALPIAKQRAQSLRSASYDLFPIVKWERDTAEFFLRMVDELGWSTAARIFDATKNRGKSGHPAGVRAKGETSDQIDAELLRLYKQRPTAPVRNIAQEAFSRGVGKSADGNRKRLEKALKQKAAKLPISSAS